MTYFVYDLIDPRNGKTFYVGKGKGNRPADHSYEAKSGGQSEKCVLIRDILAQALEVKINLIEHFGREQDALDFEASRIAAFGLDNLTNISAGGGGCRGIPDSEWVACAAELFNRTKGGKISTVLVARQKMNLLDILRDWLSRVPSIAEKHGIDWVNQKAAKFGVQFAVKNNTLVTASRF